MNGSRDEAGSHYEIVACGTPSPRISAAFAEFDIAPAGPGRILLTASLVDQAALHGALRRLQDLGLSIVEVHLTE